MTGPRPFTDAAYRVSEVTRLHIANGHAGRWAAFALSDGSSDGVAYECAGILCPNAPHCSGRADAIRHQLHESLCMYIKIPHDNFPPAHAERMLRISRQVRDAGFKLADPDRPDQEVIIPERR